MLEVVKVRGEGDSMVEVNARAVSFTLRSAHTLASHGHQSSGSPRRLSLTSHSDPHSC